MVGSVALFAGAWIEITALFTLRSNSAVAPFAGAWIEMLRDPESARMRQSFPSRERGLKLHDIVQNLLLPGRSLRGRVD